MDDPIEDAEIRAQGLRVARVREEWGTLCAMSDVTRDAREIAVAGGSSGPLKAVISRLGSLASEIESGEIVSKESAMAALSYASEFLRVSASIQYIPTAMFPLAYRRGATDKHGIVSDHLVPKGDVSRSMPITEATEMMDEFFGELLEVSPKETVNGVMTVGEWKHERGSACFALEDNFGRVAVWMSPDRWKIVDGEDK